MRNRLLLAGSIVCGVAGIALVLSQAHSSPPIQPTLLPASMPASQPVFRPDLTITSAADGGYGSLRSALRSAKQNAAVSLAGGRIVNRANLVLDVPGLALHGKPQIRSQISGRQTMITANGVTLRDLEFFGDPDLNGRSLLIFGDKNTVSDVVVENVVVHAGGDDGGSCWGRFRNITFRDCSFLSDTYAPCQKAFILGAEFKDGLPNIGADEGYAASFTRCRFAGCYGNPRCKGGVYVFRDCEFNVAALGGAILMAAKVNFINCRFNTLPKPADASYWYRDGVGPAPIVVSGYDAAGNRNEHPAPDTIYIENCTINGTPATPAELCSLSSPKGYAGVGSVPANVFRKTPW